jgi:RHS repeat-associated protein
MPSATLALRFLLGIDKADGAFLRFRRVHQFADRADESSDSLIVAFQLALDAALQLIQFSRQLFVGGEQFTQAHEGAHHVDAHLHGAFTVEHIATSNRLSSLGANAYGYSAAGNQTSAPSRTYSYDVFNRLITATVSGVVTQYRYNGLGLRLYKGGANLSRFVYDEQGQLIGEYNNTGVMTREIVWLQDIPVAIMMPSGTATSLFYIDSDHLNTPRTITNQAKQKRWEWNSDPFGTTLANENPASLGTFTFNLRFPGQYFDKETGLHYNYFRDYNPQIGRYVQSDPIGLAGGLNTFAYVEGNPTGYADPEGLRIIISGGPKFKAAVNAALDTIKANRPAMELFCECDQSSPNLHRAPGQMVVRRIASRMVMAEQVQVRLLNGTPKLSALLAQMLPARLSAHLLLALAMSWATPRPLTKAPRHAIEVTFNAAQRHPANEMQCQEKTKYGSKLACRLGRRIIRALGRL